MTSLKPLFKKAALFSRREMTPPMMETMATVYDFLHEQKIQVIWEKETAAAMNTTEGKILSADDIGKECDVAIVVGGDGCLLGAAHALVDYNIPIIGVNRGQLGFLTDINPNDVTKELTEILAGHYKEEMRFLLNAQIISADNKVIMEHTALNEVTLYAGHVAQLLEFEVNINKQFVYNQRSDGLIIATPTGSTAYALSSGGPILHPGLECMVLVPMLPHTLTSRPIVISSDSTIEVVALSDYPDKPDVSWDGRRAYSLNPHDKIVVKRHKKQLRLLHPMSYDYYQTLRTKLQWSSKLT